jgi:hypothetical protein
MNGGGGAVDALVNPQDRPADKPILDALVKHARQLQACAAATFGASPSILSSIPYDTVGPAGSTALVMVCAQGLIDDVRCAVVCLYFARFG